MALESLTGTVYINALTSTNPTSGDPKSEGDDHIRGIKNVLKLSFPNITGAITSTQTELNLLTSATVTTAEINYLDIVTLGTGEASKAVVLDASSNYTSPDAGTWTWSVSSTANFAGTFQIGGVTVTSSADKLNYSDITTLGTAEASKVLTLDASSDLNGTVNSATITTLNSRAATPRRVLLSTVTPTSVASVEITSGINAEYDIYEFEFINVIPATDSTVCRARIQIAGVFQSTNYNFAELTAASSTAQDNFPVSGVTSNVVTEPGHCGTFRIYAPSNTSAYKMLHSIIRATSPTANTAYSSLYTGYYYGGTGAITGVQFYFSSGNIASGTIKLYGIT